jgi:hypothetical protein
MDSSTENLRELSDPEFFTHWAAVRNHLCITPKGRPGHSAIKRRYDAVAAEYRRRLAPREAASRNPQQSEGDTDG